MDKQANDGAIALDRRSVMGLGLGAFAAGLSARAAVAAETSEIVSMDAVSLQTAIRSRAVSCAEVMAAHLDQIERLNPAANAVVALQPRAALMAEAAAQDALLAKGTVLGPLHGFPHAVKDLQAVKGIRYTQGSPMFRERIATADGAGAARLRKAGVIFIGKTNSPEFGLGSHTYNPVYGATHNVYDPSKSAGGSSGGAAVALALRMVPLADGSDHAGSLRNPAGWNGVYGFRPALARTDGRGSEVWLSTRSTQGPMARTVADVALLHSVLTDFDASAPIKTSVKGKRVAWAGDFGGVVPYEAGVLEACSAALKTFGDASCDVDAAYPEFSLEKAWQSFARLRAWQTGASLHGYYQDPAMRPLLKPEAVFEIESGRALTGFDVLEAGEVRRDWTAAVTRFFERYDFMVLPTAQLFPFDITSTWPRAIGGKTMRTYHEWMLGNSVISLSGCPSIAVPAGFGPSGLPIGIQIVGPPGADLACLQMAAAYEAAAAPALLRPSPLLGRA